MKKYTLVSSNDNKVKEFQRLGLPIAGRINRDLKEIISTPQLVALYKTIEAGNNNLVEDSTLNIDGKEIVDIRYRLQEIDDKQLYDLPASWTVILGVLSDGVLKMCEYTVHGTIKKPHDANTQDVFGFDAHFYPTGCEHSLHQLEKLGKKDAYSARSGCVQKFIRGDFHSIPLSSVPKWTGKYQND